MFMHLLPVWPRVCRLLCKRVFVSSFLTTFWRAPTLQLGLLCASTRIASDLEISIEPWKKLVVHEVIEYGFEDLVRIVLSQSRAEGGGIASMNWCNGLVFQHATFPDTESIVQEKLKGTIHYSSVVFARKDKFERQVVRENGTLNLADVSANPIFLRLTETLKSTPSTKS